MLYRVSEEPGIARFDPRPAVGLDHPVVWAVHEDRLRNYLLPRDCPRVTFFAGPKTFPTDAAKFLGTAACVVAIESARTTPGLLLTPNPVKLPAPKEFRRSSSTAEHRFRKAGVKGSNPFFGC
jgi:hypothetical protein